MRMNAMAFDVMVLFRDALAEISGDNDTRVVVLTGAGHGFCSGTDLESAGILSDAAHLRYEGTAQLFVRLTTQNFEEAVRARKERRQPEFRD
jgi:enoyl-CoA hydratase